MVILKLKLAYFFILIFFLPNNFCFAQTLTDTLPLKDTTAKPAVDVEKFFEANPDTLSPPPSLPSPSGRGEGGEVSADTLPKKDTVSIAPAFPVEEKPSVAEEPPAVLKKEEEHCVVEMKYIKQKSEHSPDSVFFNILKITNINAHPVQGVVKISVPVGWQIISEEETVVNIPAGQTEYIPIRLSLKRNATGGTSYIVNATLISNRSLFFDKNQNTTSKACIITIPKKILWDVHPVFRTVFVDRYTEYAPMQLKITNKGNGSEVIKLEMDIGSALQLYGALGKKYFTSIEIPPHSDTVLEFQTKYRPLDEALLWNKDFHGSTIRIIASSDSIIHRTSVHFKYLESVFYNEYGALDPTPLTIDLQMQNLLSNTIPRIFFGAEGEIVFKNFHTLDYYLRLPGILLYGYDSRNIDFGNSLWYQARFRAAYTTEKWSVMAGDVSLGGINVLGVGGRGIAGSYKIDRVHTVRGGFAVNPGSSIYFYSGSAEHNMQFKRIGLNYNLSFILNDYNKMNTYSFSTGFSYPFLPGHRISLLLTGSQTQHLYNNQTFTDAQGNFITTDDPGATFYGYGSQLQYSLNIKKTRVNLNANYYSPHFSPYNNGRIQIHGNGQYFLNKQYFLLAGANFFQYEPKIYTQGILYPARKFISASYRTEFADIIHPRLTLFAGPYFEHIKSENIFITTLQDSIQRRFSSMSPKLSLRLNYKRHTYSSITPSLLFGYTYITSAEDSLMGTPVSTAKSDFFNARIGFNIMQKNWGMNINYYYGAYDVSSQTYYYYLGNVKKTLRISPYFQRYYFNRTLLISSYNSYYYDANSNSDFERITLNARLTFFLDRGWTFFTDNNLFLSNKIQTEGARAYYRSYYLTLGIKKVFDIPQPGYKYHDMKVVCFKDINGNNIMDDNEHGLSDVVITIDRKAILDSVTKKPIRIHGHFSPAELVTDNFGQIIYYRIPSGEYGLDIVPLFNLKDLYNVNGQKQKVKIISDTTFYVPFAQSFKVFGHIILNRDEFSSLGMLSPANVRVIATNEAGNSFFTLSTFDGSYTLYVPQAGEYKVTVNNIFGDQFVLQEPEYTLSFDGAKEFQVDFIFTEKRRIVMVEGKPTTVGELLAKKPPTYIFIKPNGNGVKPVPTPTITPTPTPTTTPTPYAITGISYRIQIGASSTQLPPEQQAQRFKGAENIKEYQEGGIYKYTAGEFSLLLQAKKYRDELKNKGFKDAFIVSFKENKRITAPIDTAGLAPPTGLVPPVPPSPSDTAITYYRVQIGTSSSPLSTSELEATFKDAENIKEYREGDMYIYTAGEFTDSTSAIGYYNKLKGAGLNDIFIVRFKNNEKIK